MEIKNDIQLNSALKQIIRNVLESVSKEILEDFKKELVEEYAYVKGSPVKYPRDYGFRDAWTWTDIKEGAKEMSMTMFNEWDKLQQPSPRGKAPFIYTTFAKNSRWASDSRPYMTHYLEEMNPSIFITGNRKGKYWSQFRQKYEKSGRLKRVIDKHAKKYGLSISASVF